MKKYIVPIPSMCGFHISHPVDMNMVKNTPNRALYNNYISSSKYNCFDYITKSAQYIKGKYTCRSIKPKNIHIRYPRKTNDYYFYLGEYNRVQSGKNLAKSLFLCGNTNNFYNDFQPAYMLVLRILSNKI